MKRHTKIYLEHFGHPTWMPCEVCGTTAVDINHIEPRGMGGSKKKDYIENLVAMCRECHLKFEAKKISKQELQEIHNQFFNQ